MRARQHALMHRHDGAGRRILHLFAAATFIFMYAPIVALVVFSFSESRFLVFPILNWSWKWYDVLAHDRQMLISIWNSVIVLAVVVPGCLILGIPIAIAFNRYSFPGKTLVEQLTLIPLIVPGLITGLGILLVIKIFDISLSLYTVSVGHIVGWLPVVVTQIHATLRRFDRRLEEASMDLGAGPWQTFWRVTFPNIRGGVLGSALLVATLSLNEVAITFFLTGKDNTLPMYIWAMLRLGITPEVNAIATITIALSATAGVVALSFLRQARR